jgi:DEAD/DEAH box helicase domain-containing protein
MPTPLDTLLTILRGDRSFMANVAAWRTLSAQEPIYTPIPSTLRADVQAGLARRAIPALYSHQAEALHHAEAGRNVVVVTPTASGKSLCYNLPVFEALQSDPAARALYLFPTKALAQDQLAGLRSWVQDLPAVLPNAQAVAVYDGDTPSSERGRIRSRARIVLSNPDMLHAGILPAHTQWADFFEGLRYVVVDEIHTYRGVFGSHVANVLRRLQRICAHYGSKPQFICTSATIANPRQLAETLIEQPVQPITRNGAPRGEKQVILYNPPVYDLELGLRRSAVLETQAIAAQAVRSDVQSIIFGRSRLTTELLLTYLRESLQRDAAWVPALDLQQAVRGYRGGYLPTERRAIEAGLRSGEVRAVTATNALELGIDIGDLQAALLCGYPGSIASLWQQIGRAGRTRATSLAILVATGMPLDQYIIRHPEFIFERSPEHALVNADNLVLLVEHLRCAVAELPFAPGERFGKSEAATEMLAVMAAEGEVQQVGGRTLWAGLGSPARSFGLRSSANEPVAIQVEADTTSGAASGAASGASARIIGEVDAERAQSTVHAGAIYMHEGANYRVSALDLENSIAHVRPVQVDYYTVVDRDVQLEVLRTVAERAATGAAVGHGDVRVQAQVTGYRRMKRFTHENLGTFPLEYPPQRLETTGYWLAVTPQTQRTLAEAGAWFDSVNDYGPNWQKQREAVRARDRYRCTQCGALEPNPAQGGRQHDVHHLTPFRTFGYVAGLNERYLDANRLENLALVCRTCHRRLEAGLRTRGALDGLGHALLALAPLYLMCDREDIDAHIARAEPQHAQAAQPAPDELSAARITIYERTPAGLGFSARLYELHDELLVATRDLISACPCTAGCPGCVGPVLESGAQLETKQITLALLDLLTLQK